MNPAHVDDIFNELGFRYDPSDLYQQTIGSVLEAAELLGVPHHLKLMLAQPRREVMIHFPVKMDNGEFKLFKGYRVQHNNLLGPYKGGIRYHPTVCLDDIKSLAVLMTMKCSLAGLPYGGAKGGVQVAPWELSQNELRNLTRRFTNELVGDISPWSDIPAPDVGTNAQVMAWMADTYMNIATPTKKHTGLAVVTGKPVAFGGSPARDAATGRGIVHVLKHVFESPNTLVQAPPIRTLTYSVIGYGNVGSWTARLLNKEMMNGANLTAVLDHTGAIYNSKGIDPELLYQYVQGLGAGGVTGYPEAESITTDEFYALQVDVMIPAALEQMITLDIAKNLGCHLIAEGANAPLTPQAEQYLVGKGVEVLPAILCNCGGVIVSYYEWKQNNNAETWAKDIVEKKLQDRMVRSTEKVLQTAKTFNCRLSTAAYYVALQNIYDVYEIRGIFP